MRVSIRIDKPTAKDQRNGERLALPAFAALETEPASPDVRHDFGAIADISRSGLAVNVASPFRMGELLRVRVGIGDAIHELAARVVRCRKRGNHLYRVAIEWADQAPHVLGFMDGILRSACATHLAERARNLKLATAPYEAGPRRPPGAGAT
jgi:hypothetical protein